MRGTFNTDQIGPYRVDGGFLWNMANALIGMAADAGDLQDLSLAVRLKRRTANGYVQETSGDLSPLVSGATPRPDAVEVDVHGRLADLGPEGSFLLSLRLDPSDSDQIYAAGPALLAEAAFEEMRSRMASLEPAPLPPGPEGALMRLRRFLGSKAVHRSLLAASITTSSGTLPLCQTPYGIWGSAIAIALLVLSGLSILVDPRPRHPTWDEMKQARRAARTIDLSLPAEAPLPMLEWRPALPAPDFTG